MADHIVGPDQMIELGAGGQRVEDHFVEVTDMVEVNSSAQRSRKTVMMSRHACHLVIQNADPAPAALSA